jgi:transposase
MPAPLRIVLTEEEDRTLSELRVAKTVSQRTRDRAHMLRLNAQGWTAPAIAEIFECQEHTVRETLRRWQQLGLGGLWDASGRGAKAKWLEEDMVYLEQCLEQELRTYNSQQLSYKLKQERQVNLSADRIRRILQKRALAGNELGILNGAGKTPTTKPSNKQT